MFCVCGKLMSDFPWMIFLLIGNTCPQHCWSSSSSSTCNCVVCIYLDLAIVLLDFRLLAILCKISNEFGFIVSTMLSWFVTHNMDTKATHNTSEAAIRMNHHINGCRIRALMSNTYICIMYINHGMHFVCDGHVMLRDHLLSWWMIYLALIIWLYLKMSFKLYYHNYKYIGSEQGDVGCGMWIRMVMGESLGESSSGTCSHDMHISTHMLHIHIVVVQA